MIDKLAKGKLRWDCDAQGCFNKKKRPKIEVFGECFPGNITMGDVDGIVEINGYFIMLEWKPSINLSVGQKLMYQRISSVGFYVMVVVGDAETMDVHFFSEFWNGKQCPFQKADLAKVKARMKKWVDYVRKQPRC